MAILMGQSHHQHWGHSSLSFLRHAGNFLQSMGKQMKRYSQLAEQRQQLLEMDARQLRDIGISRADARQLVGWRWFLNDPLSCEKK